MTFISEEQRRFIKVEKQEKFELGEPWEVRSLALADASTRLSLAQPTCLDRALPLIMRYSVVCFVESITMNRIIPVLILSTLAALPWPSLAVDPVPSAAYSDPEPQPAKTPASRTAPEDRPLRGPEDFAPPPPVGATPPPNDVQEPSPRARPSPVPSVLEGF